VYYTQSLTLGRGLRLLILPLVAALVWTTVTAEPASARHTRSRAFSIVDDTQPLVGVPDRFTCSVVRSDYVCRNRDQGFRQPLITEDNGSAGLLSQNYGVNEEGTKLFSPDSFGCSYTGGPAGTRLPGEFSCQAGSRKFTLKDIAYAQDENDPNIVYGLPCSPCVKQT
jgi:hypothetical protein